MAVPQTLHQATNPTTDLIFSSDILGQSTGTWDVRQNIHLLRGETQQESVLFTLAIPLRGRRKREDDHPFAGLGTNIGVEAEDLNPHNVVDDRVQQGAALLDEFLADLLDEVASTVAGVCLGQLQLCRGQHVFQSDQNHVFDDKRLGVQGTASHELLLKADDGLRYLSFGITLVFHGDLY